MKSIQRKSLLFILIAAPFLLAGCSTPNPSHSSSGSAKSAVKPYPLDECIVTGNELGSMGDPTSLVHEGQEVKFCCAPCEKKFVANPEKYLKRLNGE